MSRRALSSRWLPVLGLMLACSQVGGSIPLRLTARVTAGRTHLILIPDDGLKISARLPPALELADGSVLRFSSPLLTADSAYFAEPPSVWLSGRHRDVHGRLRASVCDAGAAVCRSLVVEL